MPKHNWIKYAAGVVSACLLLSALTWGWDTYWAYHLQHAKERDLAVVKHSHVPPAPLVTHCLIVGSFSVICATQPNETQGEDGFTIANLKAQQEAAEWSFLSMIFSAVGIVIAGAGTFYIAKTLNATVIATNAAREATEITALQARPWVRVKIEAVTPIDNNGSMGLSVIVDGMAENIGQTPALNFTLKYKVVRLDDTEELFKFVKACAKETLESSRAVFPDVPYKPTQSENINAGKWVSIPKTYQTEWPIKNLGVIVVASYVAYGSKRVNQTPRIYKIECNEFLLDLKGECRLAPAHQKGLNPT